MRSAPPLRMMSFGVAPAVPVVLLGLSGGLDGGGPASGARLASRIARRARPDGPVAARVESLPFTSATAVADSLSGRVTDREGKPLEGARVGVPDLGREAIADAAGRFRLSNLPTGRYTVVVERTGYAAAVRTVDLSADTFLEIELVATPFELPPVEVTVARSASDASRSALPTSILGPDRLRREQGVSLAHTIEGLPGVRNVATGEQVGKPMIRGLSGPRVSVLERGIPLREFSWSGEDGPSIDARTADRVEVLRGPASVLYGSDALSGVVNVIPPPLPDPHAAGPDFSGGVEVYGASNNRETGGSVDLAGTTGSIAMSALVVGRRAEEIHTPEGEIPNTGFEALNGQLAVGSRGTWGSLDLRYSRYGGEFKLREAGSAEGDVSMRERAIEEGGPVRKLSDDRIQAHGNFPLGDFRLETKAQWQRHWLEELEEEGAAGEGAGPEIPAFELLLGSYSLDVLLHHAFAENQSGTWGASATHLDYDSREGEEPIIPDARIWQVAAFAHERWQFGRLLASIGGRIDSHSLDVDPNERISVAGGTRDFTSFTASAGASYRLTDPLSVSANVGRAWRQPTLFELYAEGPRIGEARFEIGDANLNAETSLAFDVGLRWAADRVEAEAHGFLNRVNDFIYLDPTGEIEEGFEVFRHRQADAELLGAELGVRLRPWGPLGVTGGFDYVRGTNRDLDEPLPLMPPARFTIGAELAGAFIGEEQGRVALETEIYAEQTRLTEFDTPTDSYALLHLEAGTRFRLGGRPFDVQLRIRNLLDTEYRDFLSRYKNFALDPGRDLQLRLRTEF